MRRHSSPSRRRWSHEQIALTLDAADIPERMALLGFTPDARQTKPSQSSYFYLCPFHAEKTASFHVFRRQGRWLFCCMGCGEKGDALTLERKLTGVDFLTAMEALRAERFAQPTPELIEARERVQRQRAAEGKRVRAHNLASAVAVWEAAEPIAGTIVTTYLRTARKITGYLGAADLRFHHRAPLSPYEPGKSGFRPAMVARIVNEAGEMIGAHLTFLRADGLGKAALEHLKGSRLIAGEHVGGFVRLGRVRDAAVIAEGIETALSASDVRGLPAIASLNSSNLRAVMLPPLRKAVLAFDRDRHGVGEMCAETLAERLWADGVDVEMFGPPKGVKDWNEHAQARAQTRSAA